MNKNSSVNIVETYVRTSDRPADPGDQTNTLSPASRTAPEQIPATTQDSCSTLYQLWSEVVVPFLIIRLLLLLVGVVTLFYIAPLTNHHQSIVLGSRFYHFPDMLLLMWERFDSGFYLSIAQRGYDAANKLHSMSNWAFFPLYPLLLHVIALPFGSNTDTYRFAGIVLSNSATVGAAIYLYKLTVKELGRTIAARAVLYLLLFPMSFYLSAIYPEGLFLLLVVSCIYYTRLHRWWPAGLLGGLATLTRPQGVLLALVVGWEYLQFLTDPVLPLLHYSGRVAAVQNWLRSRILNFWHSLALWRTWLGFLCLLLTPGGLVLFMVYSKWKVGAFKAFLIVEKYGWRRELTNPFSVMLYSLQHPRATTPYDWNFYILNLIVIFTFFLLLIPIFRKLPLIYGIFALAYLIMPLASGEIDSIARYYLLEFPVFLILAYWSTRGNQEQQARRHSLIVATFAILLSLGMVLFTLGVYSIA
jgi:hypothetical protein